MAVKVPDVFADRCFPAEKALAAAPSNPAGLLGPFGVWQGLAGAPPGKLQAFLVYTCFLGQAQWQVGLG